MTLCLPYLEAWDAERVRASRRLQLELLGMIAPQQGAQDHLQPEPQWFQKWAGQTTVLQQFLQ